MEERWLLSQALQVWCQVPWTACLAACLLQELHDLQSVAVPEHLQTNRSAQALRALKYPVGGWVGQGLGKLH